MALSRRTSGLAFAAMTEVALDQAAGCADLARGVSRTITIASAAAGAGRSLITANLAVALAHRGRRVLVLDCTRGGAVPAGCWAPNPAAIC
jgi:Mrp family chromosome partitioning ATPase